jgi:hypothetical protein
MVVVVASRAALAGVVSEASRPESESLRDLLKLGAVEFPPTWGIDWSEVLDIENEGPGAGVLTSEDADGRSGATADAFETGLTVAAMLTDVETHGMGLAMVRRVFIT